ncbi:tubulin binding cofactor [Oesophagostomum dentatum]|uniref:Tubulin binding cofactor n=1 Tax=Oesophagostomum dentatum TaxID=61180 RepID=A0A0B1SL29_OESDE|nr:tubulin binding cofactor [Oesophagostomum dentatum]
MCLGTDQAKLREEELTELLNRANEQVESGEVDEETVKALESFLSLEGCGWSAKRIQNTLELLRKASVGAGTEGPQKSTFSFSVSKKKPTPSPSESLKKAQPTPSPEPTSVIPNIPSDNAISLSDLTNETRVVTGKDGNDVKLKDIKNCNLYFAFCPSTVHIQGLSDSKLVFLPVETSILMHNCIRSQIFAVAQQLRIHTSNELRLHVAVRAAVIIEACTGIRMAPYRVTFNDEPVEAPPGDAWKHPRDFDWLAEGQSPNWSIAPETEWETAVIKSTS